MLVVMALLLILVLTLPILVCLLFISYRATEAMRAKNVALVEMIQAERAVTSGYDRSLDDALEVMASDR